MKRAALIVVALSSFSTFAGAADLSVGLDVDTLWRTDTGYRLFSPERHDAAFGLSAAYDVARLDERTTVALTAGWLVETLDQQWGGAHRADFEAHSLSVGAVVRWSFRSWLEPQLRLGLGGVRGQAEIQMSDGSIFSGRAFSPQASIGGGFRLRSHSTPFRRSRVRFAFAAAVEGGLTLGAPLDLRVTPPAPVDERLADDRVPIEGAHIGSLGRSHPYLRVSLATLF